MLKRPWGISKTYVHAQAQNIETMGPPLFRGNIKTINALYDFMDAVQRQKGSRLTTKQSKALINVAKALISYIEAGKSINTSDNNIVNISSITRFKRTLPKYIPNSVHERTQSPAIAAT